MSFIELVKKGNNAKHVHLSFSFVYVFKTKREAN